MVNEFCGNVLEIFIPDAPKPIMVMSSRAYNAFSLQDKETIYEHVSSIVHADISTIENIGGGSSRCMLAEIF